MSMMSKSLQRGIEVTMNVHEKEVTLDRDGEEERPACKGEHSRAFQLANGAFQLAEHSGWHKRTKAFHQ